MGRNSDTQHFLTAKNASSTLAKGSLVKRNRRKKSRQILLGVIVAILVILVLVALVFIIVDGIKAGKDNTVTPASTSEQTSPVDDPHTHGASYAIDNDDSTYMLSAENQAVGAYLLISLPTEAEIREVSILSNDATRYLRRADIQISSDNKDFKTFGEYVGTPSHADPVIVSPGKAFRATYVRIVLTEKASYPWLINSVTITTSDGEAITPRDASQATIVSDGPVTHAPAATTAVPDGYSPVYKINSDLYTGDLILVGTDHKFQFPSSDADILQMYGNRTEFKDENGKTVYSYKIAEVETCLLRANVLQKFNEMCDAYYTETGNCVLHVVANGGYRSFDTQAKLHAKYPTTASESGYSDHNTGLSVNINLSINGGSYALNENSPLGQAPLVWLTQNSYKYGFVERYPATKDSITGMAIDRYHYRYVGYPHAYYMTKNDLCLEEYLDLVRQYPYGGDHLIFTGDDGHTYEIYFTKATLDGATTTIYVPTASPYTISGNNYDGFIVTVTK